MVTSVTIWWEKSTTSMKTLDLVSVLNPDFHAVGKGFSRQPIFPRGIKNETRHSYLCFYSCHRRCRSSFRFIFYDPCCREPSVGDFGIARAPMWTPRAHLPA